MRGPSRCPSSGGGDGERVTSWTPTHQYTIGYRPQRTDRISTSPTELLHLLVAGVVLAFDFALLGTEFEGRSGLLAPNLVAVPAWLPYGVAAALTGFVAHEMAHKVSAQSHGFWAEFRMSPFGLVISLATAITIGIAFVAPGATMIGGMGDQREWGRTSLAGPAVNLLEAAAFAVASVGAGAAHLGPGVLVPLVLLAFINAWFATFNLLPFGPLDGAKVFRWSRSIWLSAFLISAAAAAIAYLFALTQIGLV
jgi:Zn-dependent protease